MLFSSSLLKLKLNYFVTVRTYIGMIPHGSIMILATVNVNDRLNQNPGKPMTHLTSYVPTDVTSTENKPDAVTQKRV